MLGASANGASTTSHHDKISPVGAGFLGAGLTAAVMLMSLATLFFLGFLSLGNRKNKGAVHTRFGTRGSDSGSEVSGLPF